MREEHVESLAGAASLLELLEHVLRFAAEGNEHLAPWRGMQLVTRECQELIKSVSDDIERRVGGETDQPASSLNQQPHRSSLAGRIKRFGGVKVANGG